MELISTYTRANAIEDGELVDVTTTAKEAGIKFPVAMTRAAWTKCVEMPQEIIDEGGQSESGRLWDVLSMMRFQISRSRGSLLLFKVIIRNKAFGPNFSEDEYNPDRHTVLLKGLCHPGDDLEPVITIMLPEED